MSTKTKAVFSCQSCGYQTPKWLGRCPDCGAWNSFIEEEFQVSTSKHGTKISLKQADPILLNSVELKVQKRLEIGIKELDRVLGGGIVRGGTILIGGDPGIGKSTIALQISSNIIKGAHKVHYVSAEESLHQTKLRAQRLGAGEKGDLYIINQTDLNLIISCMEKVKPDLMVIDSIQVIHNPDLSSSSGSISQVRECAGQLIQ